MHNPTGTEVTEVTASEANHQAHAHPRAGEYVRIAVILAFITMVEVLVYYQESLHSVIVPILLVLSAVKFSLVAMFFMHLKFDNRLFSTIFTGPLVLAFAVLIALLTIFHRVLFGA